MTAFLIDPLSSNSRARIFCERLGFSFVEFRPFDTDDCAVYQIDVTPSCHSTRHPFGFRMGWPGCAGRSLAAVRRTRP